MNQLILKNHLRPGDTVVVPKSNLRIIQHFALYLGQDDDGVHWFSDNIPVTGVRLISAEEFFYGSTEITRVERFVGTELEREQIVAKAFTKHGKQYRLLSYNCESYVNDVRSSKASSSQVGNGMAIAFFGLLLSALALSSSDERES